MTGKHDQEESGTDAKSASVDALKDCRHLHPAEPVPGSAPLYSLEQFEKEIGQVLIWWSTRQQER